LQAITSLATINGLPIKVQPYVQYAYVILPYVDLIIWRK